MVYNNGLDVDSLLDFLIMMERHMLKQSRKLCIINNYQQSAKNDRINLTLGKVGYLRNLLESISWDPP